MSVEEPGRRGFLAKVCVPCEKLTVIMPVFNEEKTVEEAIECSLASAIGDVGLELIVVNDGSTDSTRAILEAMEGSHDGLKIIHHEDNRGKGAAIRTGLPHATGTMVIIEDADLEVDPNEYIHLITPEHRPKP